jgi:DNA-binding SARP family transcriptional activator
MERRESYERAVAVSLLGGVLVSAAGVAADARPLSRRAEVAFARLAVQAGRSVSREALAAAVWGESPPVSWRPALRNVIAELRRALAAGALEESLSFSASGDGYTLSLPPGSTVDLLLLGAEAGEAERALSAGEWRLASDLAGRALLSASRAVLPGGHEDWVEGLRLEVEDVRTRVELVAARAALELGDHGQAERLARHLIETAPLREAHHRLLIGALLRAGDRAQALAAYDACRRLLAEELGALPSPQTQELFFAILERERAEQPSQPREGVGVLAAGPLLRISGTGPFVGRGELLEALAGRLALLPSAGALVSCVCGEPGIGKTRLAAELSRRAERAGAGVLYGRAEDRLSLPFAALLEALDHGLAVFDRAELELRLAGQIDALAALLPRLRPDGNGGTPVDQRRAEQAILAALALVAGPAGALLVLDDMQWASAAELGVLEALLAEPEGPRLLVLVLHRQPGELRGLGAASASPRLERVALEPLSVDEVGELLHADDGGPGASEQAERVWRSSGGNPLLVSELLRAPAAAAGQPARIGELVRVRLAALPAGGEELLRLAAIAGLEFDPETVAAASPLDGAVALECLQSAREAGLLVGAERDPRWLAFRHGLVREALLDSLEPSERARGHERLGAVLERRAPSALASLAYHFGAAAPVGDWRRAVRYALPAARQALQSGVYEDVIALATRTLATLDHAPDPDPGIRSDLEIMLGAAQRALGEPQGAETLTRAFSAAERRGDPSRMADAVLALSHAGALSEELAVDDHALSLYERALDAIGDLDPARRAQLLGRLTTAYAWRRSGEESRRWAAEAEALARAAGEQRTLAAVLTTSRRSLASCANLAEQQRLEHELLGLADDLDDPGLRVSTLLWRFDSSVQRGEGGSLEAFLRDAAADASALRMPHYHHSLAYERASLALLRGRVGEAEMLAERAATVGRELGLDAVVVEAIRLVQMIVIRGEQGRLPELRDEAAALFEPSGIASWLGLVAYIDAACGQMATVAERVDATLDHFAAEGPTAAGPVGEIAYLAAPITKLGDPARAERVLELMAPYSGQGVYFACFGGPIDYHLALLHRSLGDEPAAQRSLDAAAEFCATLQAPRWHARCQTALNPTEDHTQPQ